MTDQREEPNLSPETSTETTQETPVSAGSSTSGESSGHEAPVIEQTRHETVYSTASDYHPDDAATAAAAAAAAAAASSQHSSYSPPPPAATRKSLISRFWGFPGIVLILILIIIALFIWGILAHQEVAQKKVAVVPAQKVLHVTSAPSIAAITHAQRPMSASQTKLLMQARGAFWHHDYTGAIADYHQLIQEAPNSPAPYGELGNVLYMTGHYHQAAHAYGQAAMRLIHEGRYADGAALIPILGRLNPAEAQKVQMALSHAPEAETGMPPA